MPRSDAHTWLTALPGTDPSLLDDDGLHLRIVPPSNGRIDVVEMAVRWDGEDAVVTFETFNG
ncbi:hypothetical protein ACFWHQ_08965 [Streptomyces sp. NPDC060334]|uniref:hypothetical protein n=1 Tax=unclassified Streptomyces TaxID=2593676 RepID=UPI00332566E1